MGQTLTHGIYLPDEGERNCYSGLAANWQLLDGAVGTVAEHTTQIAGKAPLVHTHNKSDITDLLNSNFIPSANNSYDLGSSSYQWNNLYAKNYYYNGVAWGLDKGNTWSKVNTFTSILYFQWLSSGGYSDFRFQDQDAATQFILRCYSNDVTFSKRSTNGSNAFQGSQINFKDNGNLTIKTYDGTDYRVINFTPTSVHPSSSSTQDLGTSTNKWKSFNGINPGALSLPDTTREEPIDTTNWVYSYTSPNVYYPPEDGWLAFACSGSDYIQVDGNTGWGITLSKGYDGYCTGIIPVKKNVRVQIRIKETSSGSVVVRKASFYPGTGDPSFTVTPLNNS